MLLRLLLPQGQQRRRRGARGSDCPWVALQHRCPLAERQAAKGAVAVTRAVTLHRHGGPSVRRAVTNFRPLLTRAVTLHRHGRPSV